MCLVLVVFSDEAGTEDNFLVTSEEYQPLYQHSLQQGSFINHESENWNLKSENYINCFTLH